MVSMNRLDRKTQAQIVRALVEGNSIRATCRLVGVAKNTVTKLLVDLGAACSEYQDQTIRDIASKRIQADEIWAFCYAKARNVPEHMRDDSGVGDVWTWTALDADTKLMVAWWVGGRDVLDAAIFLQDLHARLRDRVQLSTDGWPGYLTTVEDEFGANVDYAQIVKKYGRDPKADETRYSPAVCTGIEIREIEGDPDPRHISTSYVERQNLTMRMSMRRFTRLTNAFSKKIENLAAAVSLHFMWYNFARPHQTLGARTTPAMAAGIADHVWSAEEIVALLDEKPRVSVGADL
jgi:IS1 family transposase